MPPRLDPDLAIVCVACLVGTVGAVLNGFILFLGFRNKHLGKKDFIFFVLNRTMIDFVYSLSIAVFQPLGILAPISFPYACDVAGFQDVALACASIAAEPVLAANRFTSVCHRGLYTKLYKKPRNLYLMCLAVWLVGVCSAIPHLFYDSLGRVTGVVCAVRFERETLVVTLLSNYILVIVSLSFVAYFNFGLFRSISSHRKRKLSNCQKTKLQKDGEVAKFIFVSAAVPLLLQTPATIGLFVRMYDVDVVNDWVMFFVTAVFVLCPMLNPIISAFMVQPLRREWRRMFGLAAEDKSVALTRRARTI